MASSSPVGLTIGGDGIRKPQWRIGKEVGSGACASVHLLETMEHGKANHNGNNNDCNFVVKIVPLPTKITKQRKTIPERNARLLHHEESIYRNQMPEYQGFLIPKLPPYIGPPVSGQVGGFQFFTMEKMKSSIWDAIPTLLQQSSDRIDIGPIAKQLVVCVEAFHNEKHLLVDIKAENFMLAYTDHDRVKNMTTKRTAVAEGIARKLRLLDLGLVTPWKGVGGHRPDDGISDIVGTPLYASLNVHENRTPSRRDDMESLGYVIAELIIRMVAAANGETSKYEGKKNQIPSYLPWSQQKSDQAIGEMKRKEVENIKSEFYRRMGDKNTAKVMDDYFKLCQGIKYKETPDYDGLKELVSSLSVLVEVPKKKAASKTKSAGRSTTTTRARVTRSKRNAASRPAAEIDDESPAKHQKRGEDNDDGFVDAAMDLDDSDIEEFEDAVEGGVQDMEWEPTKENREDHAYTGSDEESGVVIVAKSGPHNGKHFTLGGQTKSIVFSKDPQASGSDVVWQLQEDACVRLELKASRRCHHVKISNLTSGVTVKVQSQELKKGDARQAFCNDSFAIGESKFSVLPKSTQVAAKVSKKKDTPKPVATTKKTPLGSSSQGTATSTNAKGAGVRLEVISGPHKGESYSLEKGGILNFGSSRSVAKKGHPVIFGSDEAVEKQHARAQLVVASRKILKVDVSDLSDTAGTFINGKKIAKGKNMMAFANDRVKMGNTTLEVKFA